MEYYSALKRHETMLFAATWMDLETVTLSEVSQRKTSTLYHLNVKSSNSSTRAVTTIIRDAQ